VFTYVYSRYALCLLLQILLVAALDIKTRDVPTVSSINSLLSRCCKASQFFVANFYVGGGATVRFAPVVPWAKAGPAFRQRRPRGLGPTMTARGQRIVGSIGMLTQTLIMSRLDQL
jgi:hypothetical protein